MKDKVTRAYILSVGSDFVKCTNERIRCLCTAQIAMIVGEEKRRALNPNMGGVVAAGRNVKHLREMHVGAFRLLNRIVIIRARKRSWLALSLFLSYFKNTLSI